MVRTPAWGWVISVGKGNAGWDWGKGHARNAQPPSPSWGPRPSLRENVEASQYSYLTGCGIPRRLLRLVRQHEMWHGEQLGLELWVRRSPVGGLYKWPGKLRRTAVEQARDGIADAVVFGIV